PCDWRERRDCRRARRVLHPVPARAHPDDYPDFHFRPVRRDSGSDLPAALVRGAALRGTRTRGQRGDDGGWSGVVGAYRRFSIRSSAWPDAGGESPAPAAIARGDCALTVDGVVTTVGLRLE